MNADVDETSWIFAPESFLHLVLQVLERITIVILIMIVIVSMIIVMIIVLVIVIVIAIAIAIVITIIILPGGVLPPPDPHGV